MTLKLMTKQLLEFLSLKGGCIGLSESTLVKIPHCWKSHVTAHIYMCVEYKVYMQVQVYMCVECNKIYIY